MTVPTIRLEVNLSGASTGTTLHLDDPTRGLLDTGTLGDADSGFVDLTQWVRRVSTRRGSSRVEGPIIRYDAGTITTTLRNDDRRFDPTNLAGPYTSAGATQLVPMRTVRLMADYGAISYPIWRGFADSWLIDYQANYSECTLTATDAVKVLANDDRAELDAVVGAGESSGARMHRVLDSVDWPAADRDIAGGDTTLQATTLAGNALAELQLAADSEMGELYIDEGGRLFFRNRLAVYTDARSSTVQASFGDLVV